MPTDFEFLSRMLKEAKENPRYSRECEAVNFFYAVSLEHYDEETGDAIEWVRYAVLFHFDRAEELWLYRHGLIFQEDAIINEEGISLGFSVDDQGNPSVISVEEYRSIEEAYNLAMSDQGIQEREEKADNAFELNEKDGSAQYIHADHAVFAKLEQDCDAENPLENWDGVGSILSLNRNHSSYNPDKIERELMENPDTVPLAYFEHGSCLWGLAEKLRSAPGVEFQFDGREFAGVWIPDKACLEELQKLEGEKRKDKAREMAAQACEAFSQYCNGEVYTYSVEIFNAKYFDGEASADRRDYHREEPVSHDSCGGFFGYDYAKGEMKEAITGFFKDLED